MLTKKNPGTIGKQRDETPRGEHNVVCSWCGAVIRSNAADAEEQMCLICHARMLNDYFQKLRKVSDERRTARRF
jgi:hypothetical protein